MKKIIILGLVLMGIGLSSGFTIFVDELNANRMLPPCRNTTGILVSTTARVVCYNASNGAAVINASATNTASKAGLFNYNFLTTDFGTGTFGCWMECGADNPQPSFPLEIRIRFADNTTLTHIYSNQTRAYNNLSDIRGTIETASDARFDNLTQNFTETYAALVGGQAGISTDLNNSVRNITGNLTRLYLNMSDLRKTMESVADGRFDNLSQNFTDTYSMTFSELGTVSSTVNITQSWVATVSNDINTTITNNLSDIRGTIESAIAGRFDNLTKNFTETQTHLDANLSRITLKGETYWNSSNSTVSHLATTAALQNVNTTVKESNASTYHYFISGSNEDEFKADVTGLATLTGQETISDDVNSTYTNITGNITRLFALIVANSTRSYQNLSDIKAELGTIEGYIDTEILALIAGQETISDDVNSTYTNITANLTRIYLNMSDVKSAGAFDLAAVKSVNDTAKSNSTRLYDNMSDIKAGQTNVRVNETSIASAVLMYNITSGLTVNDTLYATYEVLILSGFGSYADVLPEPMRTITRAFVFGIEVYKREFERYGE